MITELMLFLIALGAGIVFIAWNNTRRRKQEAQDRREVEDSTGKLKQELERTAGEIIGRMENHVAHLENVLDESERNRALLEGRVVELKKLLKQGEGQSGEIRDLLAKLDDASAEVDSMQRKMDVVERKLNLAIATPLPIQQPVAMPQMTMPPVNQMVPPMKPAPINPPSSITMPPIMRTPPPQPKPIESPPIPQPKPIEPTPKPQVQPKPPEQKKIPEPKLEPPKPEVEPVKNFDKILEETIAEAPKVEESARTPQPRSSILISPETKQPMKIVVGDPVKIEATRKKLNEASAKMAHTSDKEISISGEVVKQKAKSKQKKRGRSARDVRKAAVEAIRAVEKQNTIEMPPAEEPKPIVLAEKSPEVKILPERRDLKLETTDSSIIKEMLLSGMTIEEISRETGLGRGAIELIQEMTRRQLNRK